MAQGEIVVRLEGAEEFKTLYDLLAQQNTLTIELADKLQKFDARLIEAEAKIDSAVNRLKSLEGRVGSLDARTIGSQVLGLAGSIGGR